MWLCRKRNFAVKETVITMHYSCILKLSSINEENLLAVDS